MLGLTADQTAATATVLSVLGAGATVVYGAIAKSEKQAHDAEMTTVNQRLKTAEEGLKAVWNKLDDLRENAVRKVDWKEYREEVRSDMRALGDRLEKLISELKEQLKEKQ